MSAGLQLGPFELGRPLGRGAMGEVWGAVHTRARVLTGASTARLNADHPRFDALT